MVMCNDGSFYTGVSTDVEERVKKHNSGKGSKYVRSRRPCYLVYKAICKDRSHAQRLEYYIRKLSVTEKLRLQQSYENSLSLRNNFGSSSSEGVDLCLEDLYE